MEVERFTTHDGLVLYKLHSVRERTVITVEPEELLSLLTWLQAHEDEITQDILANRVNDKMEEM